MQKGEGLFQRRPGSALPWAALENTPATKQPEKLEAAEVRGRSKWDMSYLKCRELLNMTTI